MIYSNKHITNITKDSIEVWSWDITFFFAPKIRFIEWIIPEERVVTEGDDKDLQAGFKCEIEKFKKWTLIAGLDRWTLPN